VSGERGDKFQPWGGASQAVATQTNEAGDITAGYLKNYSSGAPAFYGKSGTRWKTIISGGVKLTIPSYGSNKGATQASAAEAAAKIRERGGQLKSKAYAKLSLYEALAGGSQAQQAQGAQGQIANFGLVNMANFRTATG